MSLKVNRDFACGMFDQCKDTTRVKQYAPLQNCAGFLDYQVRILET